MFHEQNRAFLAERGALAYSRVFSRDESGFESALRLLLLILIVDRRLITSVSLQSFVQVTAPTVEGAY